MQNPKPTFITTKDVCEKLGVSEQRVRTLMRSGAISGQQVGKQWVTNEQALESYLNAPKKTVLPDRHRKPGNLPKIKALSFFSGAMGLDLGLEKAGIEILLTCEIDKICRQTITANRPDIAMLGDIWAYSAQDIRLAAGLGVNDDIDVIVGGPPCQAFSTAGARRGFNDNRGNALLRFIDLITELKPRFAVIENVRGLLSAPMLHTPHAERGEDWCPAPEEQPGGALYHVLSKLEQAGYGVSFNLYNAANFGVPQSRERVIILCSRDGKKLPHLIPTHADGGKYNLPQWRSLSDALKGMDTQTDYENFPESRLKFYRMLSPGQYWKHLPQHLHREAMGASLDSGGGKTGFYRRLDWNKPACTLVTSPTMPATDICHPEENRPLSVQEYMRVQEFPDDWVFCGSIKDKYKQIGNAVPVGLGAAVGRAILSHISGEEYSPPPGFPFSRYKGTDEVSWRKQFRLHEASRISQNSDKQLKLFGT
ncbi:DNA cytosine methyltransferase [Asticcacaulis sp. SL142]|uniref:DNA cytosine methyltransferase n=1 Tax=Asticcacaulis sp. SL142 TaxID=2995155 RepID=UPI00226CB011|nr:DNA cytosine methyltransferase [Asticcacaulis sp. SL142]WAC47842.1 DNA cytosine methyltransferase [Asticcacaulis sp. SL142]